MLHTGSHQFVLLTHKDLATSESGFSSEDIYTTMRNPPHTGLYWSLVLTVHEHEFYWKATLHIPRRAPFRPPIQKLTQVMLLNFNDWSISHSNTLLSHRLKVCGTTHPSIHLIFMGEDFLMPSMITPDTSHGDLWLYLSNQVPDSIF